MAVLSENQKWLLDRLCRRLEDARRDTFVDVEGTKRSIASRVGCSVRSVERILSQIRDERDAQERWEVGGIDVSIVSSR